MIWHIEYHELEFRPINFWRLCPHRYFHCLLKVIASKPEGERVRLVGVVGVGEWDKGTIALHPRICWAWNRPLLYSSPSTFFLALSKTLVSKDSKIRALHHIFRISTFISFPILEDIILGGGETNLPILRVYR